MLDSDRQENWDGGMNLAAELEILFQKDAVGKKADVCVSVTCFKYGKEAIEALSSILAQTEPVLDLVIVDDCSPDDSAATMEEWLKQNSANTKFANVLLVRHLVNRGLSQSRNTALTLARTPYMFILDADNQIYPRAIEVLRQAVEFSGYAMAYSLAEKFGDESTIFNNSLWLPDKFSHGNYIDAMTLIRTDVLRQLGGYRIMPNNFGWEDYDLWCSFVDYGFKGCHVPQILCRYRVHRNSMIRTVTNRFFSTDAKRVRDDFKAHHKIDFLF